MATWTPEQRDEAIAITREAGLAEAWRRTGIPKPSIARWARAAGVGTDHSPKTAAATAEAKARAIELRERLRYALLEKAADLLDRMDAEHVDFKGKDADAVVYPIAPAAAVQNYATSIGILIDKYRLEAGEATTRSESRALTEDMDDHERLLLRDAIHAEVARRVAERSGS